MLYACVVCGHASTTRRCPEHGGTNQRPSSWQRGYTQDFRRNRAALLASQPVCAHAGCTNPATVADHDPPRKTLVAAGVPNPDALAYLQPLCATHHRDKTQRGK